MRSSYGYTKRVLEEHSPSSSHTAAGIIPWLAGVFVLFFPPEQYAIGATAYRVWMIATAAASAIAIVVYLFKSRITSDWVLFALFYAFFFLFPSALYPTDGNLMRALYLTLQAIGCYTVLTLALSNDEQSCLASFSFAGGAMCVLNFLTYLMYRGIPGGMRSGYIEMALLRTSETAQHYYLLYYDNASYFYYLPVLCALWFYHFRYSKKLPVLQVAFTLMTVYMFFEGRSAAAMGSLATLAVAAPLFALRSRTSAPFSNYALASVVGIVLSAAIVYIVGSEFGDLLAGYVGKSSSFTGREEIWMRSLEAIGNQLIVGHGYLSTGSVLVLIGHNHCHNIFLQVLFSGGLLAGLCFISVLFLNRPRKEGLSGRWASAIVAATIVAFFVAASFDWLAGNALYCLPILISRYCLNGNHQAVRPHAHIDDDSSLNGDLGKASPHLSLG